MRTKRTFRVPRTEAEAMGDKDYSCQDYRYRNTPTAVSAIGMQNTYDTKLNAYIIKTISQFLKR
jgi:hypothetical protein